MSSRLRTVKLADKKSKLAVFGFIHEYQSLLKKNKKLFYNIPLLIFYLCISYYYDDQDKWDENKSSKNVIIDIDGNKKIVRLSHGKKAYLTNSINEGKYKWCFKITTIKDGWNFTILNNNYDALYRLDLDDGNIYRFFNNDKRYYGVRINKSIGNCNTNDLIGICMDINKNELSFVRNEKNKCVVPLAFNVNKSNKCSYKIGLMEMEYDSNNSIFVVLKYSGYVE